jgi:trimethylamine--corrinoid protein Co-methyltransferase
MRPEMAFTSSAECSLIVEQALAILETTGMCFGRCQALDVLADAGGRVDREVGIARLPADLVERTVARLPRSVLLAGATPDDDCLLESGRIHFSPSGSPNVTLDFETGEYRPSTLEDVRRATIVADAMEPVDILWSLVGATDVGPERSLFRELLTMAAWDRKHIQDDVTFPWQVEPMLEIAATLSGGLDGYRERPRISYVCCTTSPLAIDSDLVDASIGVARYGGPIVVYPMPIAGATAPLTVAGVVTMNVAEFLGVATAIELSAPGSRQIMGVGTSMLDMHATTFTFGALESALMCATGVAVAHHLGVPALAPGLATDAKYGGIQAGYEKALKGLIVAQAGADLITGGIGLLSGAGIMSLPQIVIDAEMATMIRRLLDGAEIGPATVQAETIERVAFRGDYLKEKDTARRVRAGEVFMPEIASRLSLERWQADGRDEAAAASERVREIIAAADARGPLLPAETIARLDTIAAEAETRRPVA